MGKTYTHTILVKTYTKGCWRRFAFKHNAISKESFAKDKFEGFKKGLCALGESHFQEYGLVKIACFFMIVV